MSSTSSFSTTGFIVLSDATGASSVHGGDISGNVTLTAIGLGVLLCVAILLPRKPEQREAQEWAVRQVEGP